MNDPKKIVQNRLKEAIGGEVPQEPTFRQVNQAGKDLKNRVANLTVEEKAKILAYIEADIYNQDNSFEQFFKWFYSGIPGYSTKTEEQILAEYEEMCGPEGMAPYSDEEILEILDQIPDVKK